MKVIVGLGETGLSCARYFEQRGIAYSVMDHAADQVNIDRLAEISSSARVTDVIAEELLRADEIVLSPGVPISSPEIWGAIEAGVRVTGDIAMFGELADAPIVGITGSNGKSTVTAMVGQMARKAGADAGVGGNIGTPCLDLLEQRHELFILEISSYQLEVVDNPGYRVACVLNLSPDHLDRYRDAEHYYQTKGKILEDCDTAVVGCAIQASLDLSTIQRVVTFGLDEAADFHLTRVGKRYYLAMAGDPILSVSELRVRGVHNQLNALAALAIGSSLGWASEAMIDALREFPGLPHRCESIGESCGLTWINDSKSTNVGSTLAALKGIGPEHPGLVLVLGGQAKEADFTQLSSVLERYVGAVYAYGQDRARISEQLGHGVRIMETLDDVVADIVSHAAAGGLVLFSPGCASLDQYRNFEARGDAFRRLVMGVPA